MDATPASARPLGNNTKSSPPLNGLQPSSGGACSPKKPAKKTGRKLVERARRSAEARAVRYECLTEARRLMLSSFNLDDTPSDFQGRRRLKLDDYKRVHRVAKCRYVRISEGVGVHKSKQYGTCHYGGLAICGSVWACPVCAARIQERRRLEISQAMDRAYTEGLTVSMITLTFPHQAFDSCADLLARQKDALTRFRRGRAYDEIREDIGYVGLIRALEVTHGANGWHPHTHELWFHAPGRSKGLLARLRRQWENACKRAGLIPKGKLTAFRKHAVDLKVGATSGEYLAKTADQAYWGADSELARSRLKVGAKGRPPFAILHDSAQGDKASGALFTEYVKAFHGRRQLYWTNGLKARFLIDEVDDETLAAEQSESADCLGQLDPIQWEIIRLNEARAEILTLAERKGWRGVSAWLIRYGAPVPPDPRFAYS